jgi:hypothetical protein
VAADPSTITVAPGSIGTFTAHTTITSGTAQPLQFFIWSAPNAVTRVSCAPFQVMTGESSTCSV